MNMIAKLDDQAERATTALEACQKARDPHVCCAQAARNAAILDRLANECTGENPEFAAIFNRITDTDDEATPAPTVILGGNAYALDGGVTYCCPINADGTFTPYIRERDGMGEWTTPDDWYEVDFERAEDPAAAVKAEAALHVLAGLAYTKLLKA